MKAFDSGEGLGLPGHVLRFATGLGIGATVMGAYGAFREFAEAEKQASFEQWALTAAEICITDNGKKIPLLTDAKELALTCPGLGSVDGEAYANCVQPLLDCQSAYVNYSSEGVDTLDIAQKLVTQAPELKRLHINGHSMGGRHGLEIARLAHKLSGGRIELGRIILHCSPYDWGDVRNKVTGNMVLGMHALGWQGGPRSKRIVSTVKRGLDAEGLQAKLRKENWQKAREDAEKDAESGCSPRAYPTDLYAFKRSPALHRYANDYIKLVGLETAATYVGPARSKNDRTVKTDQASRKYGAFFRSIGVHSDELLVPDMTHADVDMGCVALAGYWGR